jgi:hypothetical protein
VTVAATPAPGPPAGGFFVAGILGDPPATVTDHNPPRLPVPESPCDLRLGELGYPGLSFVVRCSLVKAEAMEAAGEPAWAAWYRTEAAACTRILDRDYPNRKG